MTSQERKVHREIKRIKPKLAKQFEACLTHAKRWKKTSRDSSSEAFSNSIRAEPCCRDLNVHLSGKPLLLSQAMACIKNCKP